MKTSYKDLFFNPSIGVKQSGYVRDMYNNEWGWDTSQSANKAKFKKTQLELNFDIEYNLNKYLKGLSSIFGIGFDFTLFQQTKYPGTDIEVQTSGSLGSMGLGNRISSNLDLGINYNLGLASLELKYELFILDFNFSKISSSSSAIRPHLIKIGLLYFIDY